MARSGCRMLALGGTSDASSGRDCSVAVFGQFPLGLILQCSLSCKTIHKEKQGIKAVHLYTENSSFPAKSYVYTGSFVSLVVGSKRKTWLLLWGGRERKQRKKRNSLIPSGRLRRRTRKNFPCVFSQVRTPLRKRLFCLVL